MALDFSALLYAPLNSAFGVTATIEVSGNSGSPFSISARDQTKGVEVEQAGNVGVFTVRPAACLRAVDLAALGLVAEDLTGAGLTMNGLSWTVKAVEAQATPNGEADGLLMLYLLEDAG